MNRAKLDGGRGWIVLAACAAVVLGAAYSPLAHAQGNPTAPSPAASAASAPLTDDQIREVLRVRIDKEHRAVGMVVGIVTGQNTRIISYGKAMSDGPVSPGYRGDASALERPLDGDTVFEIGSITKTFTANILADMARKGELSVDDPVSKFLPAGVKVPSKNGKEITLRLLAQHLSGLPRMPDNFKPGDPISQQQNYATADLYEFLNTYTLEREPGEVREYSNLGYGLLGHVLALRAGKSYEELLRDRITAPLGMNDTVIAFTPATRARLAHGHDGMARPCPNLDLDAFAGAGAIRSTVNDMLKYCAANAGIVDSPLRETFAFAQELKYPLRKGDNGLGSLAWSGESPVGDQMVLWHNGATEGYRGFIGLNRKSGVGVAVLSNCVNDIDDIAFHVIDPRWPVQIARTAIKLTPAQLDGFVGVYEIAPDVYREVTRYRDRLFVQRTGQPMRELQAETPSTFFSTQPPFQVSFDTGPGGASNTITVVSSNGTSSVAKRVDRPRQGKNYIEVDAPACDGLEGQYELDKDAVFTIRRDGDRLFATITGQIELELLPVAKDRFAYIAVDAEISFRRGADGNATTLVIHQGGADQEAKRVEP